MKKLYERFVRERKYLKNVTPKMEAWYWQSWHALVGGVLEGETVPTKAFWTAWLPCAIRASLRSA